MSRHMISLSNHKSARHQEVSLSLKEYEEEVRLCSSVLSSVVLSGTTQVLSEVSDVILEHAELLLSRVGELPFSLRGMMVNGIAAGAMSSQSISHHIGDTVMGLFSLAKNVLNPPPQPQAHELSMSGQSLLDASNIGHPHWADLIQLESNGTQNFAPCFKEFCSLIEPSLVRIFMPTREEFQSLKTHQVIKIDKKNEGLECAIESGKFTLGVSFFWLIKLREMLRQDHRVVCDEYLIKRFKSPDCVITSALGEALIDDLDHLKIKRNELIHDGFKQLSGAEKSAHFNRLLGSSTFKGFYQGNTISQTPFIALLLDHAAYHADHKTPHDPH